MTGNGYTTCNHPECKTRIPRELYACRGHWYSLPPAIREKINRGYHKGTGEWHGGHREAQEFWEAKLETKRLESKAQGELFA